MKKIEFNRKIIAQSMKFDQNYISELALQKGMNDDDIITGMLTAQLKAYVYENSLATRKIYYYAPRPKFLDWLLRRKKRVEFTFEAKDLLLTPPTNKVLRLYVPVK